MDNRSRRTDIFKILFQTEFQSGVDVSELASLYQESNEIADDEIKEITDKLNDIESHLAEIDSKIEEASNGWKLNRIGKAELAILRLSVYEILFVDDNEDAITADEAVRLAKEYTADAAPAFVNGILGTIIRGKESV
jgi:N utilization substance protein B